MATAGAWETDKLPAPSGAAVLIRAPGAPVPREENGPGQPPVPSVAPWPGPTVPGPRLEAGFCGLSGDLGCVALPAPGRVLVPGGGARKALVRSTGGSRF